MERLLTHDEQISIHRNKYDYQPSAPNTLQFAYGDRRYVKMVNELLKTTDILRFKTLKEINEDFRRSDFITLALLSSNILVVLTKLFLHKDQQIRNLSIKAVKQICTTKIGKQQIIAQNSIKNIASLMNDDSDEIRENSYLALLNFGEFRQGQDHMLTTDILEQCVDKLIEEKEE